MEIEVNGTHQSFRGRLHSPLGSTLNSYLTLCLTLGRQHYFWIPREVADGAMGIGMLPFRKGYLVVESGRDSCSPTMIKINAPPETGPVPSGMMHHPYSSETRGPSTLPPPQEELYEAATMGVILAWQNMERLVPPSSVTIRSHSMKIM
jgi:hypothetical protein